MSTAHLLMLACAAVFLVCWAVVQYVVLPAQHKRVQKALLARTLEAKTYWIGRTDVLDNWIVVLGLCCLVSLLVFMGTAVFEAWNQIQQLRNNK